MPEPRALKLWGVVPVALIALILGARAGCHTAPLARLAASPAQPTDPPRTRALAGSVDITRGGPVIIGFQSPGPARLTFAGHELVGTGLLKERYIVPHGATAIRLAAPPGARLVWSPVGRRGDPEYLPASSLSPDPPERATFSHPGTAIGDGLAGLAILLVLVATACMLARARLARITKSQRLLFGIVFVLALAVRVCGSGDQGQTWDEDVNWAAGRNYVTNVLALDGRDASWQWNFEHPPVMKLIAGVGAQLTDSFTAARWLSALEVALACMFLVAIGTRLYNRRAGFLAGAIAALYPPLIAHGQVVGHEAPTTLWWALGLALALGVHDDDPDRRTLYRRLAGVGVVVGIAIGSRFVNGLLGPLCVIAVILPSPRRTTILGALTVMPLAAVATFVALWPRLWGHPIVALEASLAKLTTLHSPEPFLGTVTNAPGAHYFLVYLVATLPVGIAIGVVAWGLRAARDRDRAALIVAAAFLVPLGVALSPVRQDGVRYVMPCLLALAIAAGAGVDALVTWLPPRIGRAMPGLVLGYLGITCAIQRPYYLDYFGELVGGPSTVEHRRWMEVAWWGEGLQPALDYVNAHAAENALVLRCIEPSHLAWFREDLWAAASATNAAWLVEYGPTNRCPVHPTMTLVFENAARGISYARVYQRK